MENIERALRIRKTIFNNSHADGCFAFDGAKEMSNSIYTARLWTPFNPQRSRGGSHRGSKAQIAFKNCALTYKLEIVFNGGPVALLLCWTENDDDIRLFTYLNGDWENHCFWLPFKGKPVASAWEKRLPTPKLITDFKLADFGGRRPWYFGGSVWEANEE